MTAPTGALLGTFSAPENKARRRFFTSGALVVIGVIAIVIGMLRIRSDGNEFGVALLIAGGVVAFASFLVALTWLPHISRRSARIHIHRDGFVLHDYRTDAVIHAALWTELDDIYHGSVVSPAGSDGQNILRAGGLLLGLYDTVLGTAVTSGIPARGKPDLISANATPKTPIFIRQSGQPEIVLDTSYNDWDALVTHVHNASIAAWYQEAIECIERGQPCTMGAFTVDDRGVTVRETLMAWSRVTSAELKPGPRQTMLFVRYLQPGGIETTEGAPVGKKGDALRRVIDSMRQRERDARPN
jgi:hypothetical protein